MAMSRPWHTLHQSTDGQGMRTLRDLKEELSRFGADNDAVETARGKRMS